MPNASVAPQLQQKLTLSKIKKDDLKNIYLNKNINNIVDSVFPDNTTVIYQCDKLSNLLEQSNIIKTFDTIFPNEKENIDNNEIYVYYKSNNSYSFFKKNKSIKIVCAAYFIIESNNINKIVIASRLHEKHVDDKKESKQGGKTEPIRRGRTLNFKRIKKINARDHKTKKDKLDNLDKKKIIMTNILNYINDNYYNHNNINADSLTDDFKNKLNEILAPKKSKEEKFDKKSTSYHEIFIENDSIFQDINRFFIKFSVNFNIIYDKKRDTIYYSKNTEDFDKKHIKKYDNQIYIQESTDASNIQNAGYNKKLKRKELNTMSLNELKQLHRNNGIKMNGNKTVNALINNYIKNYK